MTKKSLIKKTLELGDIELDPKVALTLFEAPTDVDLDQKKEHIIWSSNLNHLIDREPRPAPKGLLDAFIRLANDKATPEDFLLFAKKWGVLGICEHKLPSLHWATKLDQPIHPPWKYKSILGSGLSTDLEQYLPPDYHYNFNFCQPTRKDSISIWKYYAKQALGMLLLAAKLRGEDINWRNHQDPSWKTPLDYWELIHSDSLPPANWTADPMLSATLLSNLVNYWLLIGGVRPHFAWGFFTVPTSSKSTITLSGPHLFSALAIVLALAIHGSKGLALCTKCINSYVPDRRPTGENNYCPDCRRPALYEAQARYRKKKRRLLQTTCDGCGRAYVPTRQPRPDRKHYCPACVDNKTSSRQAQLRFQQRHHKTNQEGVTP